MLKAIAKTLKATLLGVGVLVLCAGQAHAGQYIGRWDPAFGSPFTQLGWKGSALFEIPDACLAIGGTNIFTNFSPCASGGLTMTSAEVEFYNLASPGTILDTLYFTTPSVTLAMEVTDGALSGVVGGFLTPDHSTLDIAGGNTYFWLGFVESDGDYFARLLFKQLGTCPWGRGTCPVDVGLSQISADASGSRPFMTFTPLAFDVPEPGSLALLIPALGMLATFRRRRIAG